MIFICTFDYYGQGRYKYTFNYKCEEVPKLAFGDETTKIIVNTKGTIGDVSNDFKDFIKAVNGEFDSTGYSVKIKSELEKIKSNDKWRREYMTLYLHEQDIMRKSREEGREEGIKEGIELAIKSMLKKLSIEEVTELGYDKELVERIAKEL